LSDRVLAGKQAKYNGEFFETMIESSCFYYRVNKIAHIQKTPEPMKPLRPYGRNGQFISCFVSKAQPDFKGTLYGGKAICFEAKYTSGNFITKERVNDQQLDDMFWHKLLGAEVFILVGFFDEFPAQFFRVPYEVWNDMEKIFGKKRVRKTDLTQYKVEWDGNYIKFLNDYETQKNGGREHE
jgi:recombination protein U